MDVKYWGGSAPPNLNIGGGGLEPPQPPSSYAPVMGGFRGVLGFLETPWGSPRFFPSFYSLQKLMIVATCLPNVAFSKLANGCRPPDPVQTQLSSIPVQQSDAEPPEKQRHIQVMAQRPVFGAQLYTLASCSMSATAQSHDFVE